MTSCISYEPARLVPSISLSQEDLELVEPGASTASGGVDFGLSATVNESDSLFNVEVLPGIRVREVSPGGPADRAGIRVGDVILSVNDTAINQPDALLALAAQTRQSGDFQFQVRRDTTVLAATLTARPAASAGEPLRELYRVDPLATRAGYRTVLLNVAGRGETPAVQIVDFEPASPLPAQDIRVDDVILALDGSPVLSAQGFINRVLGDYQLGERISLTLYRDEQILERRVALWDPGRRLSRVSLRPLLYYESDLNNDQARFSLLDFWIFAAYRFNRSGGERQHRLLEVFGVSSDYGELVEETPQTP